MLDTAISESQPLEETGSVHAPQLKLSAALAASALATAACGGGGGGGNASVNAPATGTTAPTTPTVTYTVAATDEEAARFLLQAQFSASDAEIVVLRNKPYATWLSEQMEAPVGAFGFDWLNQRGYATISSSTNYYDNTYPGDYMLWNQLMTSTDPMRKRVALALSEIFVVSLSGLDITWRSHAIANWWDMLSAGAFGNFRNLLQDVTLNPAMGYYLNTKGNLKENTATGRAPDENFGREVMQLFTLGLYQLP